MMQKRSAIFLLSTVAAGSAALLVAAPALAAGGGGEGKMQELIWQAVNLVILLSVIVYAARKPVTQ